MERYIWTINGKKFEDSDPIELKYGERVRLKFKNETMMAHPYASSWHVFSIRKWTA